MHFYIRVTQLVKFLCGTEWHFTLDILSTLKHDIINRLSFAVALREIDLQVELLKLLQRLIARSQMQSDNGRRSISKGTPEQNAHDDADQQNCALLLKVVHSGITDKHNADILDSWLDFTLVFGNSLPSSVRPLLFPLIDVISHEILQLAVDIFRPSSDRETHAASEDNLILLLRTVNSLVHYTLGDGFKAGQSNPNKTPVMPNESVGLLGYVFSSSTAESEISTIENGLVSPCYQTRPAILLTTFFRRPAQDGGAGKHALGHRITHGRLRSQRRIPRVAYRSGNTGSHAKFLSLTSRRIYREYR